MGHNSLSPGKLGTLGRGLMAKAPSLGKYGVQRYVANTVPSERASCALAVGEGMLGKWDQTQMNVCECRRNGNRGSILDVEKDLRCCAGCGESRTSGAQRGA